MTLAYITEINSGVPYEWKRFYARRVSFVNGKVIHIRDVGEYEYRYNNCTQYVDVSKEDLLANDYYICTKHGDSI